MRRFAQLLTLILGLGMWGFTAHATTVGRTAGTFAVNNAGAATYSIPIWAPHGPKGMQPSMALTYNSQSGNGYLGVGWNLAGLSSIYRCNLTYAQDAAPAAVSLSTSDGYCLDGQRLRLTSGTYGTAGSTYQTEIANFQNVIAYGTAGSGPAYFIVQTPDGRTLQYGNGGNSQVLASGRSTALAWMLNQVSDPPGNTMTISYSTATGTVVPSVISWTPTSHGAGTYAYTMTFGYGANVLPTAGYVAGTPVQNPNLLGSITIDYSGTQVKEYVLTYTQSGTTGRDTLTQIQECAASTSNCLYPTTISYQAGSVGVSTSATTAISSPLQSTWTSFAARYDFNGDGYTDLLYEVGSTWYVAFGSASGYGSPVSTGITGGSLSATLLVGDLLGTGSAGIVANHSGTWYYYTWNGSSFVGSSTGLAFDTTAAQFALADTNGDGLVDLVALYNSPIPGATVKTRLNTSSGGTPSFSTATVTAYTTNTGDGTLVSPDSQSGNVKYFDFNGDGRQDLAIDLYTCLAVYQNTCVEMGTLVDELVSQSGGTYIAQTIASYAGPPVPGYAIFGNFNNDACTDVVAGQLTNNTFIASCGGPSVGWATSTYPVVAVMDWNGDGQADLIENYNGTLYVQLSNGNGFGVATATALAYNANCTYTTLDANGDGLDDLGCLSTASGTHGFTYYTHTGAGTPPDLLTSVTDGYGNSASTTYASIVQSNYTGGAGTYPDVAYLSPIYVANNVTYSDPSSISGGTYNQTFHYYQSYMNVEGRGWDGFYEYATTDSRSGLTEYRTHWIQFPQTGFPAFDDVYSGGQEVSHVAGTPAAITLSSTSYQQRYFPYSSNVTAQRWEFGGTENSDLITTTSTNYSYDSYGNATTIAQTTTDNDPGSAFHGDSWTVTTTNTPDASTSPWCLNLLTETQVAYTASVGSSVTRTKQFSPDITNCRYTQVVTEPTSGTYKVTEALGYDSFGNVNSDAVTGIGMTARTTTAGWGTTGQFPASVTDPSGAVTQFNYNFSFGVPSSVIDPNNLTTSWLYGDGFGRKTQETRPDGTYTKWTYTDCPSWGGCLIGSHGIALAHEVFSTTGTDITDGTDFYDPVDRPLFSDWVSMISGTYYRGEVRYDSLGRLAQKAAPCVYVNNTTPCSYWTTTSYDALNRVTQIQRPISASNGTLQTLSYAYAGRTTTVTDPNSNATTIIKDVNGWQRQTKDALNYAINFGYDAAGSRTAVTDSLSNTLWTGIYSYGVNALLTSESDMDRGAWSYGYDALGEGTSWTDAKGQNFSATFDALSRPLTRTEPDLYTAWTWGSSASSHNFGSIQSVCTGTGSSPTSCTPSTGYSEAETYDSLARLSQRSITLGSAGTFNYQWAYDSNSGLLSTLTYPTSTSSYALQLQYGYSNGILQSVTDISDSTHVTVWTANSANPAGQITQETLGNGIITNRAYDAVTHWLGSVTSGVGGGSGVQNQSFLFDEVGNVTQRQDGNLGLTENLYYDNDYRLTSSKLNGSTNLSIGYDATGDITSRSDVASGATWTYDPVRKHAVTQAGSSAYTYAYDANGNATSRQGSSIIWKSYNYPMSASAGSGSTAETVTFAYGPDRSRWQQNYTGNSTTETTDYIGGLLELVTSAGVNDYRHYIYAGNEPVAVYSRKSTGVNTFSYLLSDHEGSIADITNSSGALDIGESFTPFGNRRNPATWSGSASNTDLTTAASITRQGYTFQTQLGLWMGMNHMNGRVQDAITGRFLSADPFGTDDNNAQSFNRYSYVENNPLTFIDPTGFYTACTFLLQVASAGQMTGTALDSQGNAIPNQSSTAPTLIPNQTGELCEDFPDPVLVIPYGTPPGGGPSTPGPPPPPPPPKTQIPCLPGVQCMKPQPTPKPTPCPRGATAWAGGALYSAGADLMKIGATWGLSGVVGMEGGAAMSAVGAPEVGGPVAGVGAFAFSAGGILSTIGVGSRLLGAGILSLLEGSPRTAISAVGSVATDQLGSAVNQRVNVPADTPSVFGWVSDALFGEDQCAAN